MQPLKLTPATRRILRFIADGGERGRMLLQVVASGGSAARRYRDLKNAGLVEDVLGLVDQPDRVRATAAGLAALAPGVR
jgi:hypothetical protein